MKKILSIVMFGLNMHGGFASDNFTQKKEEQILGSITGCYIEYLGCDSYNPDEARKLELLNKINDGLNINNCFDDICSQVPVYHFGGNYDSKFYTLLSNKFFQMIPQSIQYPESCYTHETRNYLFLVPELVKNKKMAINTNTIMYKRLLALTLFVSKLINKIPDYYNDKWNLKQIYPSVLNFFQDKDRNIYDEVDHSMNELFSLVTISNIENHYDSEWKKASSHLESLIELFIPKNYQDPVKTLLIHSIQGIFTQYSLIEGINDYKKLATLIVEKNWHYWGEEEFLKAVVFLNNSNFNNDFKTQFIKEVNQRIQLPENKKKMLVDIFKTKGDYSQSDLNQAFQEIKEFFKDPDFSRTILLTYNENVTTPTHYTSLQKLLSLGINPQKVFVSDLESNTFSQLALYQYKLALNSTGMKQKINEDNPQSDLRWKYLPKHIKNSLVYAYLVLYKELKFPKDIVKYILAMTPVSMDDWFKKS